MATSTTPRNGAGPRQCIVENPTTERTQRFEQWNPYAAAISGQEISAEAIATLALAYEVSQMRAAYFRNK